jgi:hypothetical protein
MMFGRMLMASALLLFAAQMPCHSQTKAEDQRAREVIGRARAAIGGEAKLAAITSLQAEGKLSRLMGDQTVTGELQISVLLPDKYKRVETTSLLAGDVEMTTTTAVDGAEAWTDTSTSGGATTVVRFGPKGNEADNKRAFERSQRAEFARTVIAWLLAAPASTSAGFTYAGEGATDKGRFDMVDITGPDGFSVRLFLDTQTHLPALLSYRGVAPRMRIRRMEGGGSPEEAEKKAGEELAKPEDQPQRAAVNEIQVLLSDYRSEGGILLPHKLTKAAGGTTFEEVEITKYKINPSLKPQAFKK